MSREWTAEVEIDAATARRLIAHRFPELAHARVEPFGNGWDNAAFLVGEAHVFRFPRPAMHADFLASYGGVDERTWSRARYRAIYSAALVAEYGDASCDRALREAGLWALATIRESTAL